MNRFALTAVAIVAALTTASSGAVLVDDKFNDGSIANGTDATETDTTWSAYNSSGAISVVGAGDASAIDGNTLRFGVSGNTRLIGAMPTVTLANAGDSVTLAASYRFDSTYTGQRGVRFGLESFTAPLAGYAFSFIPGGASTIGGEIFRYKTLEGGANENGVEGGNATRFETTNPSDGVQQISLTITRLENNALELTAAGSFIVGGSATVTTSTTPATYSFDRISVRFDNAAQGNTGVAYFDNITLTTTSVPEPASLGLAMVAGGLMLARRRSRK